MKAEKQYIHGRFVNLYMDAWKSKGKTQKMFVDAVKALDPGNGITVSYVSKLLNGKYTPSARNLQIFCKVLGVDSEPEFTPSTSAEKYRYSAEYQDRVTEYFEQVADSFGLNLSFLNGLRQIVDFDKEFPMFTELIVAAADPMQFFPSGLTYKRAEKGECSEASSGKRLFQITIGDKVYNMEPADIKFLKAVQNCIVRKVNELFAKHRQELIDAANLAAERCEGYSFAQMITSGKDPLSPEELQKIDKWGIYTVDEYKRFNFPLPPDDLQLTSAHIEPGIVIGRKQK